MKITFEDLFFEIFCWTVIPFFMLTEKCESKSVRVIGLILSIPFFPLLIFIGLPFLIIYVLIMAFKEI